MGQQNVNKLIPKETLYNLEDWGRRGYTDKTIEYNGISDHSFSTPFGKIDVNLPNSIAPKDTVTATVTINPTGKTKEEIGKNEADLKKFQIQLPDGKSMNVSDNNPFTFVAPETRIGENANLLLIKDKKPVSVSSVDLIEYLSPENKFVLPTGGQQGKYLVLRGPFNGLIEVNDSVRISENPVSIIAETPRERMILNTSEAIGLTRIVSNENGQISECTFRNIGIKMSADNLDLLRGQTTTLHVQVSGLSEIIEEIPVAIFNNSPAVISISGGNNQLIKINPKMVNPDGTFNLNQTLTGIVSGGFGVTGTVTWGENCGNETDTEPKDKTKDEKKITPPVKEKDKELVSDIWWAFLQGEKDGIIEGIRATDPELAGNIVRWLEASEKFEKQKIKTQEVGTAYLKAADNLEKAKKTSSDANAGQKDAAQTAVKDAEQAKAAAKKNFDTEKAVRKTAEDELKQAEKNVDPKIRENIQKEAETKLEKAKQEKVIEKKPN